MAYKQVNNTCELEGCENGTFSKKLCHYHRTIIKNRKCAYYYHKLEGAAYVAWCGECDKPIYQLDCEKCISQLDPIFGIKIIEKLNKLNRG